MNVAHSSSVPNTFDIHASNEETPHRSRQSAPERLAPGGSFVWQMARVRFYSTPSKKEVHAFISMKSISSAAGCGIPRHCEIDARRGAGVSMRISKSKFVAGCQCLKRRSFVIRWDQHRDFRHWRIHPVQQPQKSGGAWIGKREGEGRCNRRQCDLSST